MKRGSNRVKTIRLHEMELRKHRLKVQDQHKELCDLSRENLELYKTVENLGATHTAIMAAVAEKFGAQTGDGVKEIVIPPVDIVKLVQEYEIKVARMEDKSTIIRIEKKERGA